MDTTSFISQLPKVELHVHLEGTVTPEFWSNLVKHRSLLQRFVFQQNSFRNNQSSIFQKIAFHLNSIKSYYQNQFLKSPFLCPFSITHLKKRYNYRYFSDFLDTYGDILRSFNSEDDLKQLVKNYLHDAAAQNVRYCEMMFTPWFFEKMGFDFFDLMFAIDEGAKSVEQKCNIQMKLLFDGPRNFGNEVVKEVFDSALKDPTGRVIGVGLGGDEKNFPAKWFKDEFDFAKANGLKLIAHAGETDGEQSMTDAIEYLQVSRLGHGLGVKENSRLESLILKHPITIDACPNSNIATGSLDDIKKHPLKEYLRRGYPVTINSDDPALFKTSLTKEFETAKNILGLNNQELIQLSKNAVSGSFLSNEDKRKLWDELTAFHDSSEHLNKVEVN